jgi:hypothetical protein
MDSGLRAKLARQQTKEESGESSVDPLAVRPVSDHRREIVDEQLAAKLAEQQEREQSGGSSKIEASLVPRSISPRAVEPQLAAHFERRRILEESAETN